ncbi:MAG: HD domain-containing protein [Endomicrobium sp.]|jgi:HD-GYP domain-containing protein (c-di-GMP phosphodiesterase class II)|nr:HD domain-containing protein [Endomicrobium sp.]
MQKLRADIVNRIFSAGLDIVESQIAGATYNHSLRLAVLACETGKRLGYGQEQLLVIETAALFHDNSLSRYLTAPGGKQTDLKLLREHCEIGARNLSWLPFSKEVCEIVLNHHERADGSGAFGKHKGEYSRPAAIVSLIDYLDVTYHLQTHPPNSAPLLKDIVRCAASKGFDKEDTDIFADILDEDMLLSLKDDKISRSFHSAAPQWTVDMEDETIYSVGEMFSKIIDFKSHFTNTHTKRIANAVWIMGKYYGYDNTTLNKLFLAASLHDICKLLIPTDILEKPDKLTKEEYAVMKHHMDRTYEILSAIPDFEDAALWAANHHEKLAGGGYPEGKTAEDLDFNSRLMACTDIWEALTAHRPYQKTFYGHGRALEIMRDMADKNFIDPAIVSDIDKVLLKYDGKKIPNPSGHYNY